MPILNVISNEESCVELVHEYFDGKYTKDEIRVLLYQFNKIGNLSVRRGVEKLSEEWHKLKQYDSTTINTWYQETDFYIFDLLPWNACHMFTAKMDAIYPVLERHKVKNVIDYGGGLGITSILLRERFPEMEILYCDFKNGHQFKFFEYLIRKLNIPNIKTIDVDELLGNPTKPHYDAVLAMDCFEHIPDLNHTLKKLLPYTNLLVHDSTFHQNIAQPQHVNHNGDSWFVNLMLSHGFFMPELNFKVFQRFKLCLEENLVMRFYAAQDMYET
jgi:SAM-dependent methyltransferase